MRILIAHGSKMGGTEGLAGMLGTDLTSAGFEVDVVPAAKVKDLRPYEAVIIGGALYAGRWHKDARSLVKRFQTDLVRQAVWFFASGPLDDSAEERTIPPVSQIQKLMDLVHAKGYMTFGGRLPADAKGFPASAMAKNHAGDWRDPEHVSAWADEIVNDLRSLPVHWDSPTGQPAH
ncbi:MAG: flavodoxin domain-containing protein [Acidimicrobiia bacterium]